jgi:glycosyltransferase involved in cell wall biosynthesis
LNSEPRVSVGLPVAGGIVDTERAVRSVFAQTEPNWELIIVCDGAPSELVNRMRQITDPRVTVRDHSQNMGLPTRLNEISQIAASEYVARMDSDDVMHPKRLEIQLGYMDLNRDVDVLGSGSYLIDELNEVRGQYREPPLPTRKSGFLQSGIFSHPTVMFRTKWSLENPYDPSRIRTEDKDLWLRASGHSRYEKLQDNLLYCQVPKALSIEKQALTARRDRRLIRELGRSVAPRHHVCSKLAESRVKQVIFWISGMLGQTTRLHRTKYKLLSQKELEQAQETLQIASATAVPGWD